MFCLGYDCGLSWTVSDYCIKFGGLVALLSSFTASIIITYLYSILMLPYDGGLKTWTSFEA